MMMIASLASPLAAHARDAPTSALHEDLYLLLSALVLLQAIFLFVLIVERHRNSRVQSPREKDYAEVTHASRLALIGELSASIAHEVTQPLSAILSNVETARALLKASDPDISAIVEILEDVRKDDLRAHDIVKKLRILLRKRELQLEHVDINALTSSVLSLALPDAVRRNIVIRTGLDPNLPKVPADPVHLQQVLLNLIINAMDSMEETPPAARWLEVRTERCDADHVQVTVRDNGPGIEPEQRIKIFDSFFTTKPEGMGLGLSVARTIVAMHGGAIWAENSRSGGAAFMFTVPVRTT